MRFEMCPCFPSAWFGSFSSFLCPVNFRARLSIFKHKPEMLPASDVFENVPRRSFPWKVGAEGLFPALETSGSSCRSRLSGSSARALGPSAGVHIPPLGPGLGRRNVSPSGLWPVLDMGLGAVGEEAPGTRALSWEGNAGGLGGSTPRRRGCPAIVFSSVTPPLPRVSGFGPKMNSLVLLLPLRQAPVPPVGRVLAAKRTTGTKCLHEIFQGHRRALGSSPSPETNTHLQ